MTEIVIQRLERFTKFLERRRKKFMVVYGGRHSGKSFALAQLFIQRLYEEDDIRMLVLRKTLPALKITAYRLIVDLLEQYQLPFAQNKTVPMTIKYGNNEILFGSLDDPEKYKCFTPDTEILTDCGFRLIPDIKEGDSVATYDFNTDRGFFAPVNKTWSYDYSGPMISPLKDKKQRYIDFCVTPDHNFLRRRRIHHTNSYSKSNYEFVKAKDLTGRSYIPRSAIWGGEIKEDYTIPTIEGGVKTTTFPIIPWLKFLGWYLSEGCLASEKTYEIYITQTKEKGRQKLKDDLKDFPYKIWWAPESARMAGKALYYYLLSLGKYAPNKRIPRDILNLHPTLLKYIFESLMDGDGSLTESGRYIFGSTSKGLIDDVSEISIKLGLVPSVFEVDTKKPSFYPNAKRFWFVSISKQDETILEKVTSSPYKGKIYGLEVMPHHTVLIRYKGRVMWSGQSFEGNYLWVEEATELTFDEFLKISLVMSRRNLVYLNQIFMTFNPISCKHWAMVNFVNAERDDIAVMHSTYLDNPFLAQDHVKQLENLINQDDSLYRIYVLGKCGEIKDRIYKCVTGAYPDQLDRVRYGLDFGFNNPSALLEAGFQGDLCYERELLYQSHLTNQELIEILKMLIEYPKAPIYADPAEPARIAAIKQAGFNIFPANNSVRDGIDFVKTCNPIIDSGSVNLINEKQDYKWQEKAGVVLDVPVKFRDHLMACERYALYSPAGKQSKALFYSVQGEAYTQASAGAGVRRKKGK